MSASYCFVLHGRCIAPRVRDSIFAEHQRPQVAAFMECVDFMQPRWPSRISTFDSIFCRSFRFGTRESVGGFSGANQHSSKLENKIASTTRQFLTSNGTKRHNMPTQVAIRGRLYWKFYKMQRIGE